MNDLLFLVGLGFILAHFLGWGFKHLPAERWQMLAVVPLRKAGDDHWLGSNLTYYGFFVATSQLLSMTLLLILIGAMGLSIPGTMFAILIVLTCCIPAAQLWRILSETLRAEFRGFGEISAYQKMGMMSVFYIIGVIYFVHAAPYANPEILDGIGVLWNPSVILSLQILWLIFFYTFGRSTVTSSTISFELIKKNI